MVHRVDLRPVQVLLPAAAEPSVDAVASVRRVPRVTLLPRDLRPSVPRRKTRGRDNRLRTEDVLGGRIDIAA
jgi:hypothetical protein